MSPAEAGQLATMALLDVPLALLAVRLAATLVRRAERTSTYVLPPILPRDHDGNFGDVHEDVANGRTWVRLTGGWHELESPRRRWNDNAAALVRDTAARSREARTAKKQHEPYNIPATWPRQFA